VRRAFQRGAMPDRSPVLQAAIADGLASLARERPTLIDFKLVEEAPDGRRWVGITAHFTSAARRVLQAAAVQRPQIRGFMIETFDVADTEGGVVVAAKLAQDVVTT
jgi:hypothetical protein